MTRKLRREQPQRCWHQVVHQKPSSKHSTLRLPMPFKFFVAESETFWWARNWPHTERTDQRSAWTISRRKGGNCLGHHRRCCFLPCFALHLRMGTSGWQDVHFDRPCILVAPLTPTALSSIFFMAHGSARRLFALVCNCSDPGWPMAVQRRQHFALSSLLVCGAT